MSHHAAVDIGTTTGTVFLGRVDSGVEVEEVHRFEPATTAEDGRVVWDVPEVAQQVVTGLRKLRAECPDVSTVGIDATAELFGFVRDGTVTVPPAQTHSIHTGGDESLSVSPEERFRRTGHTRFPDTMSLGEDTSAAVAEADWVGLLPALIGSQIGARPFGEITYAVSAGLGNVTTRDWSHSVLSEIGFPTESLPELVSVGDSVGTLSESAVSFDTQPTLVAVPGHDTSAATVGTPFDGDCHALVSTGSWVVSGYELSSPVLPTDGAVPPGENMCGGTETARYVQNTPGFSLFEHCRETWGTDGTTPDYETLLAAARQAPPDGPLFDPDDDRFLRAHYSGDVVATLRDYWRETGQRVPDDRGAVARSIFDSLAISCGLSLQTLGEAASVSPDVIHVIGGGTHNDRFCRALADTVGKTVRAGPVEATAVGSTIVQAVADGSLDSVERGRELLARSTDTTEYAPDGDASWSDRVGRLRELRRQMT